MRRRSIILSVVLILGIGMGVLIAGRFDFMTPSTAQNITSSSIKSAPTPYTSAYDLEKSTINVAQKIGQAVVSISSETVRARPRTQQRQYFFGEPFGGESPFDDFFNRFFDDYFGEMPQRLRGLGSGVIISNEGYILTNEHVVGGADKLTVKLSDGRQFRAEIKGTDPRSDLAIIKINASNLPVAALGDSENLKIGQWVVAIGNPFGYVLENPEPTVTVGVISALHRSLGRGLGRERDYSDLIQTDAAINPGNSGGPLVNLAGNIIGINVAIFSTSGGYQGVGFAIPINAAKRIISQLIEGQKILYGWLGVSIQDINEDLKNYFNLQTTDGALVAQVLENSPAQKAKLREGDVIVSFDGKEVHNANELVRNVGLAQVGKKAPLEIIREGKRMAITIEIGERPEAVEEGIESIISESAWRGVEVGPIDEQIRRQFNLSDGQGGVVIVGIEPGSPAEEAGLTIGDVIVSINRQPVGSLDEYKKVTGALKGDCLVRTIRGYFVVKG